MRTSQSLSYARRSVDWIQAICCLNASCHPPHHISFWTVMVPAAENPQGEAGAMGPLAVAGLAALVSHKTPSATHLGNELAKSGPPLVRLNNCIPPPPPGTHAQPLRHPRDADRRNSLEAGRDGGGDEGQAFGRETGDQADEVFVSKLMQSRAGCRWSRFASHWRDPPAPWPASFECSAALVRSVDCGMNSASSAVVQRDRHRMHSGLTARAEDSPSCTLNHASNADMSWCARRNINMR